MMTMDEYQAGVAALVKLAQAGTGGGRAAAQVILSAYNGQAFQLDITDLCVLDAKNYQAALSVIRGRVELGTEPHNLIVDGDTIFGEIWDMWKRYSLENRHKDLCRECYGSGTESNEHGEVVGTCRLCGGTGLEEVGTCG